MLVAHLELTQVEQLSVVRPSCELQLQTAHDGAIAMQNDVR